MSLVVGREKSRPVLEACQETGLAWKKYSKCSATTCVEMAFLEDRVLVRDSKEVDQGGRHLTMSHSEWRDFLSSVRAGYCPPDSRVQYVERGDGFSISDAVCSLSFYRDEWDAFILGVRAGEFDLRDAELIGGAVR